MYDIAFIGAGPCNISGAHYLHEKSKSSFIVIDCGKKILDRDHNSGIDCVSGVGGAGLFSDGKFSHYPAGNNVWKLEKTKLKESYAFLKSIMDEFANVPEFMTDDNTLLKKDNEWNLKSYTTYYLSLKQRYDLIKKITNYDNFLLETEVIDITKSQGCYNIICKNIITGRMTTIKAKNIVMGGGRFMPLFIQKITFIPTEFKRIELGIRIEGHSSEPLYNISDNIDPKFTSHDPVNKIEYRTFCWCRDGETACTTFYTSDKSIKTWSGRSDCEQTNKSNFGFNVIFRDVKYLHLLEKALNTEPFIKSMNKPATLEEYDEVYDYIKVGIESFFKFNNVQNTSEYQIYGPTIEGVGYYPITDENLKVKDENIWIGGDATGKFRGIIASMLSGIFISSIISHNKPKSKAKPLVILLSGKRFSGKSAASSIIKDIYINQNKSVKVTSFSYSLKKQFCENNNLSLDQFLADHEYKDKYRVQLTKYYDTTNPATFTKYTENEIDKNEFDVYVIDDLRSFEFQIDYLLKNCSDKWNMKFIRINSSDENKQKRGWINTDYDKHQCETELDTYTEFDYIVNNDSDINEYEKTIRMILETIS